jgi:CheY-like chemotaxis protein
MQQYQILWADDEIALLKPHILFLEKKGYHIKAVTSGIEAVELCDTETYDLIFLDENMPGMSGLEALSQIKQRKPHIPVVMITKSEEEHIMEEAIGSKISDYLIKPINPNQILLSIKKLLDGKKIQSQKTNHNYMQDFQKLNLVLGDDLDHEQWAEVHKKLVYWQLEIEKSDNQSMVEVLETQKTEANSLFARYIKENYLNWFSSKNQSKPLLSDALFRSKVLPYLQEDRVAFFILIDNLRFDQWKTIEPFVAELFDIEEESTYYSILPTTTAFARNAIFSGMMPLEIIKKFPQYWVDDNEDGGKNDFERELLQFQLKTSLRSEIKFSYHKIIHSNQGRLLLDQLPNLMHNRFNALVFNFVDMLSHAKTDTLMIRELANDEAAYRSLTLSWFQHSPLFELLKQLSQKKARVILTTDHGTVLVKQPYKIIGDRETNTNLRYKQGKKLSYEPKHVLSIDKPELAFLPKPNVSTSYVFATQDHFFAYPNNFNHYVQYYKDTFQHGGISLEEMIIPFVVFA